jgi:hypothetical protein
LRKGKLALILSHTPGVAPQQELEIAAGSKGERALDVVQDTVCAASRMWLFNDTNRTGDDICFFQNGSIGTITDGG